MLRNTLIFLSVILLAGAGYLAYDTWIKDSDLNVWSFVPENAIYIYENHDAAASLEMAESTQSWKLISVLEGIKGVNQTMDYLDSLLNNEGKSRELIKNMPLSVSCHLTSQNSFDFLYVLEVRNNELYNSINKIQSAFREDGYTKKVRSYLDFNISEFSKKSQVEFTYIFYKNFFIGSRTAYLVEDAIRVFSTSDTPGFREVNPELFEIVKLKKDLGNLFINLREVRNFLRAFDKDILEFEFGKSAFFDMEITDETIQLDGFAYPDKKGLLNQMKNIDGSLFDLAEIVSNDEALFHHFSFRNSLSFRENILLELGPDMKSSKAGVLAEYDFDVDHTFTLADQEAGIGVRYSRGETFRTLYLKVQESENAWTFFQTGAERIARSQENELFTENYDGFEIIKLNIPNFPGSILGQVARGFEECYFTRYRNYLLFANNLQGLRKNIDDIQEENTWRKSLRKIDFLEKTNPQANYSLFINTAAVWNHMIRVLDPKWQDFANSNEFVLKQFDNISVQFNQTDGRFFTNIIADIPDAGDLGDSNPVEERTIFLDQPIGTKPFLFQNKEGKFDIVVQDTTNRLFMISNDFRVLWDVELGEKIRRDIETIDFYNNGNEQFIFITKSAIHVIDKEGTYVPGFPVSLDMATELTHLSIIDYDGNKRYRFGIADADGKVYLTDKNGKPLEGWNPRYFKGPVTEAPLHYRIGNRDLIMIQLERGEIHMLSRRARDFPGFPMKLNESIANHYNLVPGSDFASSRLTTITRPGELMVVDLKASVLNREELFKPTANTEFSIVNSISGRSFIILRKSENQYDILDRNGNILFQKDYLDDDFFIQYYDLSPSRQYVVIGNPRDQFVYIYDIKGNLITSRPLLGNNPISMIYSGNTDEHQIYLAHQNELKLIQLN